MRATMAPLAGPEKAAIENFFASKRGQRVLLPSSRDKLALYHVDKSVTLPELPVARPPDPAQLEDWVEEWTDTATAAGITDTLDVKNVGRWMMEVDSSSSAGLRSGKAFAVADALAKKGVVLDRSHEMATTAALAQADKGDMRQQCRHVDVIWNLSLSR